jgi:hypothetical protein
MFISHKYRFIFVKTRKTAGSSIEKFLRDVHEDPLEYVHAGMPPENLKPVNLKKTKNRKIEHAGWKLISKIYPTEWKSYYKFTIERNSWDKVVSTYFWQKQNGPWKINEFDDYVKTQGKLFNRNDWNLYTKNNQLVVDNVIQYNNLSQDFSEIAVKLKIPYNDELKTIRLKGNIRKNNYYRDMYTEETKEIVRQSFAAPIAHFNYQF